MCWFLYRWNFWWWRLCPLASLKATSMRWTRRCRWLGCSRECWTCSRWDSHCFTEYFLLLFLLINFVGFSNPCIAYLLVDPIYLSHSPQFRSKVWRSVWTSGAETWRTWPCSWNNKPMTFSPKTCWNNANFPLWPVKTVFLLVFFGLHPFGYCHFSKLTVVLYKRNLLSSIISVWTNCP